MTLKLLLVGSLVVCLPVVGFPQAGTFLDLNAAAPSPPSGVIINVATASIVADFSFSPTTGAWPLTVQFNDLTQGGPTSWAWNFGDGGTATVQHPVHTFNSAATFTVSLTATGPGGSSATNHNITVTNAPTWAVGFGGTLSDGGAATALDSSGNIILGGFFSGTANFGGTNVTSVGTSDMFLGKYSASHVHQWSEAFGGTGIEQINAIAIDPGGNIYVAGTYTGNGNFGGSTFGNAGQYDCFLAKYTSGGAHVWSQHYGSTGRDVFTGIVIDSQTNIIVTGTFQLTVNFGGTNLVSSQGFPNVMVAKYKSDGTHLFSQKFPSSGAGTPSIAIDRNDNIFLAGSFVFSINFGGGVLNAATAQYEDIYIAKFATTGTTLGFTWANRHGSIYTDRATAVAVDGNGDVAVAGNFFTQTDLGNGVVLGASADQDLWIAKYSGVNGAYIWAYVWKGLTMGGNFTGLRTDAFNNIVSSGYFYGRTSDGTTILQSQNNSYDIFVLEYTSLGGLELANSYGSPGSDEGLAIGMTGDNYPIITGYFSGSVNFNGTILNALGATDTVLMKMADVQPTIPDLVSLTNVPTITSFTNGLTSYVTTTGNDGTFVRGDVSHPALHIDSAVANSQVGDTISVASGNYTISNRVTLKKNMKILGAGTANTIVTNWVLSSDSGGTPNSGAGSGFLPADNTAISNLWIINAEAIVGGSDFQSAIGTSHPDITTNDFGFTNAVASVKITGTTDAFFIFTTNHCQFFGFNCDSKTTWDFAATGGDYANHDIRYYSCTFTNKGADSHGQVAGGTLLGGTNNVVFMQNCSLYSDKADGYVGFLIESPVLVYSSCTFDLPNSVNTWITYNPTAGIRKATAIVLNCNIADSKVSSPSGGFLVRTNLP